MITIYTLWQATWIVGGIWLLSKLFKMCIFEMLTENGGEKYLNNKLEKTWKVYLEEKWLNFHLKK
jgi:fatty acid desaturase